MTKPLKHLFIHPKTGIEFCESSLEKSIDRIGNVCILPLITESNNAKVQEAIQSISVYADDEALCKPDVVVNDFAVELLNTMDILCHSNYYLIYGPVVIASHDEDSGLPSSVWNQAKKFVAYATKHNNYVNSEHDDYPSFTK